MYRIFAAGLVGIVICMAGCSRTAPDAVLSETDMPVIRTVIPRAITTAGEVVLTARAELTIKARVAHTTAYDYDTLSGLAPKDIVFAWGPALATPVLSGIQISQEQRWFTWKPRAPLTQPPIPGRLLDLHLANMHVIGADEGIAKVLRGLRVDDAVALEGYLVDLKGGAFTDPLYTSLSLTDSGLSSSETFYVTSVQVLN